MNKFIVSDTDPQRVVLLCHSYMGAAESKYSPQIVAGSYIGWLTEILRHLTARYRDWRLEGLSDAEDYRGLGDRVFAMVFRRIYGAEIDRVGVDEIDADFKRDLVSLKGKLSFQRGALAEQRAAREDDRLPFL